MFRAVYLHNWFLGPSGTGEVKTVPELHHSRPNGHITVNLAADTFNVKKFTFCPHIVVVCVDLGTKPLFPYTPLTDWFV
jgi:hypothetical protein